MPPPNPTERELQALKVIWCFGQATVREICDAMNRAGTELAYTTVLSLLQVMEQKGLIGHVAHGKVYSYFAKVERAVIYRQLAGGFLQSVFDGALDEYVVHALESRQLSAAELDQLQQRIAVARQRLCSHQGEST